jgi:hypothetical protein
LAKGLRAGFFTGLAVFKIEDDRVEDLGDMVAKRPLGFMRKGRKSPRIARRFRNDGLGVGLDELSQSHGSPWMLHP